MTNEQINPASKNRVTMSTVGRLAGVSQVTVSRALSHPEKVSPDTLQRIQEAIETTGFVPNALAGALASKRSKLITALIPSLTNIVYSSFIATFSKHLRDNGYQILLSETGFDSEAEETLIATHLSRRPDAMLLTGIHHSAQARRLLLSADIPVVEMWDITDSPIDMCVGFNHAAAGRAVAAFLHTRKHARAATITAGDERAHRRQCAFASAFEQLTGQSVQDSNIGGPASIGAGRRALADLIENKGLKDGVVFCSSDLLAHGALIEARARGLNVPADLSVMGFGDQDFAADLDPALSTVVIDRARLGNVAADMLLRRMGGAQPVQSVHDIGFKILDRASI